MPELRSNFAWPGPRSGAVALASLRALWTLPTNIIGHVAGFVASGGRRPRSVRGVVARGFVYEIRRGVGLDWVSAVTLGHVILGRPGVFDGLRGRAVLAHELAHTRQHDVMGPLYLPAHILAQSVSALLTVLLPGEPQSRVHDYNPLEHTFICLGASACYALAQGHLLDPGETRRYLERFGV